MFNAPSCSVPPPPGQGALVPLGRAPRALAGGPGVGFNGPEGSPHAALPSRLGRYRLLARLGSGGMAHVLLAMTGDGPSGFHKLHVLKVLRPDLPATERADFLQMFLDEGRLAMRLSHPHVVQAYEVGSEGASRFIAMEYFEGQPLSAIQRRAWNTAPGLSLEMQVHVLCQVLDGLDYAHGLRDYGGRKLNLVHRDVSPQNVLVNYSGHARLVDFGIAKALDSSGKTAAGVVKGKVQYIAPEQLRGSSVDLRADLFSVGVMLWEAAAQRSMHGQASLYDIVQRLVSGELPRLRDAVPSVERRLDQIVSRALAHDPDQRYSDARQLRDDLIEFSRRRPRVSGRELGERVAHWFEPERRALQDVIRAALSETTPSTPAAAPERRCEDHVTPAQALEAAPLPWADEASSNAETGRVTLRTAAPNAPPVVPASAPPPHATPPVDTQARTVAALAPTAELRVRSATRRVRRAAIGGLIALAAATGVWLASPEASELRLPSVGLPAESRRTVPAELEGPKAPHEADVREDVTEKATLARAELPRGGTALVRADREHEMRAATELSASGEAAAPAPDVSASAAATALSSGEEPGAETADETVGDRSRARPAELPQRKTRPRQERRLGAGGVLGRDRLPPRHATRPADTDLPMLPPARASTPRASTLRAPTLEEDFYPDWGGAPGARFDGSASPK